MTLEEYEAVLSSATFPQNPHQPQLFVLIPSLQQMTLEEYEAVLAEKRAGLNTQRESAFKADEKQFNGMKTFEKVEEDVGLGLTKNVKVG